MADPRTRERIVEIVRKLREHTADQGCTSAEAARFAAKAAEWVEKYQISEAELRQGGESAPHEIEVCENTFRTGKKVFNPGVTAIFSALADAMCCELIMITSRYPQHEAIYGITGDVLDADYVCQIAAVVIPSLQIQARLEGVEHGYEKAGLIRWTNQFLSGAAEEIRRRIEQERRDRAEVKTIEHELKVEAAARTGTSTALTLVTGETLAVAKRAAALEAFKAKYPKTRTTHSRCEYDGTARERGREAGKSVGLHLGIEGG